MGIFFKLLGIFQLFLPFANWCLRATSKTLDTALPQFMGESVRMSLFLLLKVKLTAVLVTTYCVYAELKKLGPDFRPTAAMAKKLEKRRCTHSPAVTAAECIKSIIGNLFVPLLISV